MKMGMPQVRLQRQLRLMQKGVAKSLRGPVPRNLHVAHGTRLKLCWTNHPPGSGCATECRFGHWGNWHEKVFQTITVKDTNITTTRTTRAIKNKQLIIRKVGSEMALAVKRSCNVVDAKNCAKL